MKARKLNLTEAFELAEIISKYVDTQNASPDAVQFIADIVDKLTPQEYLLGVKILTNTTDEDVNNGDSISILTVFIEGLKLNQIYTLVSFYQSIGL